MKTFWFWALLAAGIGAVTAWSINYSRYGYRPTKFGPFTVGGEVTPENIANYVKLQSDDKFEKVGKIELDGESVHDFGVMSPGDEGEHVYKVRNVGDGVLKLRVGASTCKCTLGELNKSELAPGEETEVKLSWSIKAGTSEFGQSAQLLTNDPTNVAITLEIKGRVIADFQPLPEVLTFGDIASGDSFEVTGDVYNFMKTEVTPTEARFSSQDMNDLAEFEIKTLERSEFGPGTEKAIQGFRISAKVKPGLKQGSISQSLLFAFNLRVASSDEASESSDETNGDSNEVSEQMVSIPVKGRVVGVMRMLESGKLTDYDGEYVYDFGRLGPNDSLVAKTFVVLKGDQRDNATLRVGQTAPTDVVRATLGEPKTRGTMVLYPLEIELVPTDKPIARLGKDKTDYGSIWIESDNPKVSRMRVVLKFAIGGR